MWNVESGNPLALSSGHTLMAL